MVDCENCSNFLFFQFDFAVLPIEKGILFHAPPATHTFNFLPYSAILKGAISDLRLKGLACSFLSLKFLSAPEYAWSRACHKLSVPCPFTCVNESKSKQLSWAQINVISQLTLQKLLNFFIKKKVVIVLNHYDLGWFLTQQELITYAKKKW